MKIKRYTAPSMRAALALVRAEQGPDAVILSSRRSEEGIEVIAAVDYDEALFADAKRQAPTHHSRPAWCRPDRAARAGAAATASRGDTATRSGTAISACRAPTGSGTRARRRHAPRSNTPAPAAARAPSLRRRVQAPRAAADYGAMQRELQDMRRCSRPDSPA